MILLYRSITVLLSLIELFIIIRILLSFLNIRRSNLFINLVYELTEPVLGPIRDLIKNLGIRTGMFDFTPLIAVIILRAISNFIRIRLM